MDIALGFNFAAGGESLRLGLRSSSIARQSPGGVMQLRIRWRSVNSGRIVVRAAEEAEFNTREVAGVKRGSRPFSENVRPETSKSYAGEEYWEDDREQRQQRRAVKRIAKAETAARQVEEKLTHTAGRKRYVEEQLAKLDGQMKLAGPPPVKEQITEEERYMFMKLGLRMRARLLLGRRGVFGGTVENMHLHWKHRELVKIIFKGPLFEAEQTAKVLEVESGGVLVGIIATSKGQAIIFYRGKDYERPSILRPRNLLTKRQAMQRSLETQRKHSLEQHILKLEKEIGKLQVYLNYAGEGDSDLERLFLSETRGTDLEDFDDAEFEADADDSENTRDDVKYSVPKEENLNPRSVTLDPIFKAQPLTIQERIRLRQEALKKCDPLLINVGKSNIVAGLAKAIRLYFQKHPFAIVGVKGRAKGTPVVEIIQQIEEATGAVLVSREPNKLILYRGWPAGEQRPDMVSEDEKEEVVPQELRAAILSEEVRDPLDFSYLTREECSLLGIEYRGTGNEENDCERAESEQEDEANSGFDMWNDNEITEAGADMWTQGNWYTEEEEEEEEEDDEAETWSSELETIEAD
ncbi:hypothetical protein M758_4G212100 [Ceratodon purpureus]|nr:hypothetical protein M758_4G212100 [Ceratodon purpureus]